jgi:hypothetical protein
MFDSEKRRLKALLKRNKIPTHTWGRGEAKSFDCLCTELTTDQCVVYQDLGIGGGLRRMTSNVAVNVFYKTKKETFGLIEEKQVFHDGRERHRSLSTSIGEKMKKGKTPLAEVRRALSEELMISGSVDIRERGIVMTEPKEAQSFPGLITVHLNYLFDVFLPEHAYKPEGYTERRHYLTSYFVWHKV